MEVPGRRVPEGSDVTEQLERRKRRAKGALLVGAVTLLAAVGGSFAAGGSKPSNQVTLLALIYLMCVIATPVAFAVAGANLTSSDSWFKRMALALAAGAASFLVMMYFVIRAYFEGGGSIHM